ncbi:BQ2448_3459 [Microbotryum intermedium]|uniref:BQ2448_3459 protein n=1 Tax=Microbotryum intermedium TaxID=269621 RepID=A0A238FBZ9_9BASI|nr:BQ2448_3459 [Microbotryum intermedium]
MVYPHTRHAVFASVALFFVFVLPTCVLAREATITAPNGNISMLSDATYTPTSVDDAEDETENDTLFGQSFTEVEGPLEKPHWPSLLKRARARSLPPPGDAWNGRTTMQVTGRLGIGAMQAIQSSDDEIMSEFLDKAQNNPLIVDGHSAWGVIYNINTGEQTVFCAGGTFISNGDIISVGGQTSENTELGKPGVAGDGFTTVRVFQPTTHQFLDNAKEAHIQAARWYASVVRVTDGSALVLGGSNRGQFNNNGTVNVATLEFLPSKGPQLYSRFLRDSLDSNLFPIAFLLSHSGNVFVMANEIAMIYDWKTNVEHRVGRLPGGIVRTYPGSATAVLLPLTVQDRWVSEVLICGGVFNTVDLTQPGYNARADKPVSNQCVRTSFPGGSRISGWKIEYMPTSRIMGDPVITPDGKVLIVGGAQTGVAGYGNAISRVGQSNADRPALVPVLYDPKAPAGVRFSNNFPPASVERMYHSVAMLTTKGNILSMGSSPNSRVLTKNVYKTRRAKAHGESAFTRSFEVETINPPYMTKKRPTILTRPEKIDYNGRYTLTISNPMNCGYPRVVLIDSGYATHGMHMNQRSVELRVTSFPDQSTITFRGPQNTTIWPPGPGFLWVTVCKGNIPSNGHKIMVGDGSNPPNYNFPL